MALMPLQARVDRELYQRFKMFAHANGVTVESAIQELMRGALDHAGVPAKTAAAAVSDERKEK